MVKKQDFSGSEGDPRLEEHGQTITGINLM